MEYSWSSPDDPIFVQIDLTFWEDNSVIVEYVCLLSCQFRWTQKAERGWQFFHYNCTSEFVLTSYVAVWRECVNSQHYVLCTFFESK